MKAWGPTRARVPAHGRDLVQVGVVEGEGDVGGVEDDEGRDNVGIGVWLDVEDLKEDVEGGGGVADGPDLGGLVLRAARLSEEALCD